MVTIGGETYLIAIEAAKHLGIARGTFYQLYRDDLVPVTIGKRKRLHYRLSDLEKINRVRPRVQVKLVEAVS